MPIPKFGSPTNLSIYVLDQETPIRVPKGCELLLTLTVVKEDGTSETALHAPVMTLDPYAPLIRRMINTEHDGDPKKGIP